MTDTVKSGLLAAYSKLLRPLVRILLRHGITYAELAEIIKQVYVHTAAQKFRVPGKKMSKARIAIITGLTRKEVQRIATIEPGVQLKEKTTFSRIGRVISGWHTDPDFTGPYGMPLELIYDSDNQADVTFVRLVQRFSGDMTPRAMLDELLRVGAVIETDQNWFRAIWREYVPNSMAPNFLDRVGSGIHNFVTTIETNMQKEGPGKGRFERSVWRPGGIKSSDLPVFDEFVRDKCQSMLDDIDNWLSKLDAPEADDKTASLNSGVGIYHYVVRKEDDMERLQDLLEDRSQIN
jgi:hypothetical protein